MRLDWKAVLGIAVTILLLWWALRDVEFAEVWVQIRAGNVLLLAAAGLVAATGLVVRALRWNVLLQPLCPGTSLRSRFAAVSVGFMANNVLPWRVGEFARAYVLSRVEPVRASGAFGTLVVERAMDGITLLTFLLVAMAWPTFPSAGGLGTGPLRAAVVGFSVLAVGIVAGMVALLLVPRPILRWTRAAASFLPAAVGRLLVDALEAFLGALGILRSPRLVLLAALWSVGFWLFNAISYWLAFLAYGIDLDFVAAVFTEAVVGFGVALPSAPGFIGTFHYAADLALSGVYGVAEARSLAFAFGLHIAGWIPVTGLGLWYAWRLGLGLGEVGRSEERVERSIEAESRDPVVGPGSAVAAVSGVAAPPRRVPWPVASAVQIDAPAKVNLVLRVLGRDPETGYHDLETVFQAIDLSDRLRIEPAPGDEVTLEVEGADMGPAADNLVTRAARAFSEAAGGVGGLRIRLEKRIPAGAGLGGGSSDAAATLLALDTLFGGLLDRTTLERLAASLGADVPFFLGGAPTSVAWGRGDRLRPLPALPPRSLVVAFPGVHVATGEAYRALAERREASGVGPSEPRLEGLEAVDWGWVVEHAVNDFEAVVPEKHPAILRARRSLDDTRPRFALLAGSGSAVFAVYEEPDRAEAAGAVVDGPGVRAFVARTLEAMPAPVLGPRP